MLVRLDREPVAPSQSVPLRAWWERIHDADTIPVERHTAADLYDIRGRVAEPGCRFDVGRRSSKRHCLLGRVARPDAADGNHDDVRPPHGRDDGIRIGDVAGRSGKASVVEFEAFGIARNADDLVTPAKRFLTITRPTLPLAP